MEYYPNVTVLEAIQEGDRRLSGCGVENPRLEAELLLEQFLAHRRLEFPLIYNRLLPEIVLEVFRQSVLRRSKREPLQHILGSVSFCGFEIAVGSQALIPRPETELLAERAWLFLKGKTVAKNPTFLEIGAGTGCLSIAILGHCPNALAYAVDISPEALKLAQRNVARHGMSDRIVFHLGDGFTPLPLGMQYDLVISNPPYIPTAEIETLSPEVRLFDPRLALDGGPDGLRFYRILAHEAARWLKPEGQLMVEFGDGQAPAISRLFEENGWRMESIGKDYAGKERLLEASMK